MKIVEVEIRHSDGTTTVNKVRKNFISKKDIGKLVYDTDTHEASLIVDIREVEYNGTL